MVSRIEEPKNEELENLDYGNSFESFRWKFQFESDRRASISVRYREPFEDAL